MKAVLLVVSLLALVGCAGHRPQVIKVHLTPQPTLERPEAWVSKAYPETHCMAYLNVNADAQHVTWLEQAWEVPAWGSMMDCPGSLKLCETIDVATCREVTQPRHGTPYTTLVTRRDEAVERAGPRAFVGPANHR